jgi:hypothetical protein
MVEASIEQTYLPLGKQLAANGKEGKKKNLYAKKKY